MGIYTTISEKQSDKIEMKVSSQNKVDLVVTPPPEFNGPENKWSPEDLFCASISSCYVLTFTSYAKHKKLDWESIKVEVDAHLEKTKEGLKFTQVTIKPHLTICCSMQMDPYLELLHKSKDKCLVTNSMNCSFEVVPKIKSVTKKA